MAKNRTIIMVAFSCRPGQGSEPGVGFQFVRALSRATQNNNWDAIVLTRSHTAEQVRLALSESERQAVRLVPLKLPTLLVKITGRRLVRIAYLYWECCAALWLLRYIRSNADAELVVHHVTFSSSVLPTILPLLPEHVRTVLGPAGSVRVPPAGRVGVRERIITLVRRAGEWWNSLGLSLFVSQNEEVAREWRRRLGYGRVLVEPNVVVETGQRDRALSLREQREPGTIRICAVGGLITRKNFDLALRALSEFPYPWALTIAGKGPEEGRLRALASSLGLEDRVTFAGELSQLMVYRLMALSDVLVHPSVQEGAGWVVGEAQAMGCIPVVLSGAGPGTLVDLAGIGAISSTADVAGFRHALLRAVTMQSGQPSDRWSEERLAELLKDWY